MKIKWQTIGTPTRLAIKYERLDGTVSFNRQNVIAFHIDENQTMTYMDVNGFTYKSSTPREFGFAEVLINGEWTL